MRPPCPTAPPPPPPRADGLRAGGGGGRAVFLFPENERLLGFMVWGLWCCGFDASCSVGMHSLHALSWMCAAAAAAGGGCGTNSSNSSRSGGDIAISIALNLTTTPPPLIYVHMNSLPIARYVSHHTLHSSHTGGKQLPLECWVQDGV